MNVTKTNNIETNNFYKYVNFGFDASKLNSSDIILIRKIILFNSEINKFNKQNHFEKDYKKEKNLLREREKIKSIIKKIKPELNEDKILKNIIKKNFLL